MSRKYQVWAFSFAIADKPQIVFEAATEDRAEEIQDEYIKEGFETFITYTEPSNPNFYKRI